MLTPGSQLTGALRAKLKNRRTTVTLKLGGNSKVNPVRNPGGTLNPDEITKNATQPQSNGALFLTG
jgi:hypothetical protein